MTGRATAAAVSAGFLVLASALAGCGSGEEGGGRGGQPLLVEVEPVQRGAVARTLDLTAEVTPAETVQLAATVDGPIDYLPWREGDTVEAGQRLVTINRESFRAEYAVAEAAARVARAKLEDLRAGTRREEIDKAVESAREAEEHAEFARIDLERVTQLVESGALPREEGDKARVQHTEAQARLTTARRHLDMLRAGPTPTALAVQEATVEEADAKRALARARLDECVITAPFDGIVTKTFARRGDTAAARAPLVEMADMDSLVLRFAVPEAHATVLRRGIPLTFVLDALPGRTFETEVVRVYPDLDPRTRTRTVEAELPDTADVVPNMFARVRIEFDRADDAVLVPAQAVQTDASGGHFVFVADDGRAHRRDVDLGIEQRDLVQVLRGVEPGDRVVVAGQAALRDKQPVRMPGDAGAREGEGPGSRPGAGRGNGPGAGSGG